MPTTTALRRAGTSSSQPVYAYDRHHPPAMCIVLSATAPTPPPQAAQALVRLLLGRRREEPSISATLLSSAEARCTLELTNVGSDLARDLAYAVRTSDGLEHAEAGTLSSGASRAVPLRGRPPTDDIACVWSCLALDGHGHVWSYDGRYKRVRRGRRLDLVGTLRRWYPTNAD